MWSWLLHMTGVDDVSGKWYAFWSGFGSVLIPIAIGVGLWWHKNNCHQPLCLRIGRFPDGQWHVCGKHHPQERPGADRGGRMTGQTGRRA